MTNEQREDVDKLRERFEPDKFGGICALGYKNKYCFGKSDLQAIDTVLSLIKEQQEEMEKKDKIIDLMAERINWLCKTNGILLDREHGVNFTEEDIKQYFERKVEDVKD